MVAAIVAEPALAARKAFVVGIDNYATLPKLAKAAGDAAAMTKLFGELGFAVTTRTDVGKADLERDWKRFVADITSEDVVAVFFAGHGLQIDGLNYLMPRDASVGDGTEKALKATAMSFHELMEDVEVKVPLASLYILDACRDNPLAKFGAKIKGTFGQARGLAKIESVYGAFVLYSAGPGEQALDALSDNDKAANSVFTRHLLPLLRSPTASLVEVAKAVQVKVEEVARTEVVADGKKVEHKQRPAYFDGILGSFYLGDRADPLRSSGGRTDLAANERVIFMSRHAQWNSRDNCRSFPPPRLKVADQPRYGQVITRFERGKVDQVAFGDEICTGTTQRYIGLYYLADPEHNGTDKVDTFKIDLGYFEGGNNLTRVLEFNVNLSLKTAPYRTLRSR
jgi:hypothetical protein